MKYSFGFDFDFDFDLRANQERKEVDPERNVWRGGKREVEKMNNLTGVGIK